MRVVLLYGIITNVQGSLIFVLMAVLIMLSMSLICIDMVMIKYEYQDHSSFESSIEYTGTYTVDVPHKSYNLPIPKGNMVCL